MIVAIYTVLGFAVGSVPFAFWLARHRLGVDVRKYGADKNPGALNAFRAGGWKVGLPGGLLDFFKGFVPVFLAQYISHLSGWALFLIAAVPVLGHVFSPFLRFQGGKAMAASFGVWAGLTQGFGFLAYAASCGVLWVVQKVDAWAAVLGLLGLLVFLIIVEAEPYLFAFWVLNASLITYKHGPELKQRMRLRALYPR